MTKESVKAAAAAVFLMIACLAGAQASPVGIQMTNGAGEATCSISNAEPLGAFPSAVRGRASRTILPVAIRD